MESEATNNLPENPNTGFWPKSLTIPWHLQMLLDLLSSSSKLFVVPDIKHRCVHSLNDSLTFPHTMKCQLDPSSSIVNKWLLPSLSPPFTALSRYWGLSWIPGSKMAGKLACKIYILFLLLWKLQLNYLNILNAHRRRCNLCLLAHPRRSHTLG